MTLWEPKYALRLFLISILWLAGVTSLLSTSQAGGRPAPLKQESVPLAGTYSGNVIVSEPAPLGALTLVMGVTNNGGALSGDVDPTQTLVFLGGPSFTGSVTAGAGVTPTFHIQSETFVRVVSGRTVERKFTLNGEILQDANVLKGIYEETITGFTPEPMIVHGTFLLTRPFNSEIIIPPRVGGPVKPTPFVPDPNVPGPDLDDETEVRLPIILSNEAATTSQEATPEVLPEIVPEITPEHTLYLPETIKEE